MNEMTFTVTDEWLVKYSNNGAWTADQFESLGLPRLPIKGWRARVLGTQISAQAARRFERMLKRKEARSVGAQSLDLF